MSKQEQIRTQAFHSIPQSAERKINSIEEKNAINVFSRPEAKGLIGTTDFFAALRKTCFFQDLKRIRVRHEDWLMSLKLLY